MKPPEGASGKPKWEVPAPYGYPAAVETAGAVTAPLLAGFGIALIGQILVQPRQLRWADAALATLSLGVVLLVFAVQAAVEARRFTVDPATLQMWWPDHDDPDRKAQLVADQHRYANEHARAAGRFRRLFNSGLLFLLGGIAVALVPKHDVHTWRVIAIAIFGIATLWELWVVVSNWAASLGAPSKNPLSPRRLGRRRSSAN